jgi:transcription elongation factor Elf1
MKIYVPGVDLTFNLWRIKDEKYCLLNFPEDETVENKIDFMFSNLLHTECPDLTPMDKLYVLVYMYSKGINNLIPMQPFTCPHCNQMTDSVLNVEQSIKYKKYTTKKYRRDNKMFVFVKGHDMLSRVLYIQDLNTKQMLDKIEVLDDLDLKTLSFFDKYTQDLEGHFKFEGQLKCLWCGQPIVIERDANQLLEKYVLSSNIIDFYNVLLYCKIQGNFSVEEYENLYPFEKEVIVNKLQEIYKKDENS